jgi:hypothetical protein
LQVPPEERLTEAEVTPYVQAITDMLAKGGKGGKGRPIARPPDMEACETGAYPLVREAAS